jgi:hypothetical protein
LKFDMGSARLPATLRAGFAEIRGANKLVLSELVHSTDPGQISLTFFSPTALVNLHMFRLPKGKAEFERLIEFFGQERKARTRLPDGPVFGAAVLDAKGVPADWKHDAFARSGRDLFHAYRGIEGALFVRWFSRNRSSPLVDPMMSTLHGGLRILPAQWETAVPEVVTQSTTKAPSDRALSKALRTEVAEAAARARTSLMVGKRLPGPAVIATMGSALDGLKRPTPEKAKALAVEWGSLWGETLRAATDWEWRTITDETSNEVHALCSPDRSLFIEPTAWIHALLTAKRRPANNLLLTFNLIVAGKTPPSAPKAYKRLG